MNTKQKNQLIDELKQVVRSEERAQMEIVKKFKDAVKKKDANLAYILQWDTESVMTAQHVLFRTEWATESLTAGLKDVKGDKLEAVREYAQRQVDDAIDAALRCRWDPCSTSPTANLEKMAEHRAVMRMASIFRAWLAQAKHREEVTAERNGKVA